MTDLILKTLTERERIALFDAEQVIQRGLQTFVEVGTALATIRDDRLYRTGYNTFEAYCQERWGFDRTRAQNFITAARMALEISNTGLPAPAKESQARELAKVPEADRPAVWQQVLDATGGKPTAAAIRAAAQPESTPDPRMVEDVELPGLGEQYKPDPGERIKDVGDAAPEYVQRADATPETPAGRDPNPARGPVATTGRPDTTPAPTWSEDEEQLRKQLQAGQTVVVSYRAHHANVVRWAEQQGLLVRVDRRSDWGNPFEMPADGDRDTVIAHYAEHYLPHKPSLLNRIESLTGKALACWCAPEPCHGDVLKEATEQ